MLCSADTDSQVTYRRLSAVDRYIIAVRRCYRSIRRMQDRCSLVLWIDVWDSGSTVSFLHAAFWTVALFLCICFCLFRVAADNFSSLYVSEFLIAACGISPLRGRLKDSALKNPAALERLANFFLWVRVCGCCALENKKIREN